MTFKATDLTQGNIYNTLLRFAIPFFAASFLQALYGTVDMIIVGWFTNAAGISAVSIGSQVMYIINALITGLALGATVLIAQYLGAGQANAIKDTVSTMLLLFTICAVILTVTILVFTDSIISLLNTPPQAVDGCRDYISIAAIGIFFTLIYNGISAIFRGYGDSRSPLLFIAIACIGNIILDYLMIGIFGMGPAGAALATIISQALSMILAIVYLKKIPQLASLSIKSFRLHYQKLRQLIKLGLPISLQESLVHTSFLIITVIVNSYGVDASAAVGISNKFNGFAMLPAIAFYGAVAAMVAQNMGAGNHRRAMQTLKVGVICSLVGSLFFFFWVQFWPESVLRIFNSSPNVIAAGIQYMRPFSWEFIMVSFIFSLQGFMTGCGKTTFCMFNEVLSSIVFRIPLAFILSSALGLFGIGLAAPIASLATIAIALIYIRSGRWRKNTVINQPI